MYNFGNNKCQIKKIEFNSTVEIWCINIKFSINKCPFLFQLKWKLHLQNKRTVKCHKCQNKSFRAADVTSQRLVLAGSDVCFQEHSSAHYWSVNEWQDGGGLIVLGF